MGNAAERLSIRDIATIRASLEHNIPTCRICGLIINGHSFKPLGRAPIRRRNSDQAEALLKCVREGDWDSVTKFDAWDGLSDNVEVIGLKCVDGRCSIAMLLYPFALEEPTLLMLQEPVPGCAGPLQNDFYGPI